MSKEMDTRFDKDFEALKECTANLKKGESVCSKARAGRSTATSRHGGRRASRHQASRGHGGRRYSSSSDALR